jgi:glycogen synthase
LKICLLSPQYPGYGGYGVYLSYLVKGLRGKGHEVHTLTGPPPRERLPSLDEEFHIMPTGSLEAFRFVNFEMQINWRLPGLQRSEEYDLIQYNLPTYFGIPLFHSRSLPLLITAHGCTAALIRDLLHYRPQGLDLADFVDIGTGPIFPRMERWAFTQADHVVAVCDWVRGALIKLYKLQDEEVTVVRNGIDTQRFHPIASPRERVAHLIGEENLERPLILFMARIMGVKDPATLALTIPLVLKTHPDALFLFRGEGVTLHNYLRSLLQKVAPKDSYKFIEYLSGDEIPALYSAASIYILPSIHEPFAYTLLEALACGVPVIASAVGGVPELITNEKNGLLVEPRNPAVLAEAISRLLDDEKLARSLRRSAREVMETNFNLDLFTERFDREIRKLAG